MLKLLHRHVFKETLTAIALAMVFFVFVLLVGNALRDMVGLMAAGKLDFLTFIRLLGLFIPYVAAYALPLGMLTGILIAIGRLSSQREIIAMKSAGWSLYQISAPVVCLAFIGVIFGILINLHFAPRSKVAARDILTRSISDNPLDFIEEKRFIHEFPGFVIYMGSKTGDRMEDFWVWELDVQKRVKRFVRAASGELRFDAASSELVLRVYDATAELRDNHSPEDLGGNQMKTIFFKQTDFTLPLEKVFGRSHKVRLKIRNMDFSQLMGMRREALLAEESTSGNSGISSERMQAQVQLQKNFAMAFSTFSLALFGVPLAIQVGRKETYANLAIALLVAMSYYFLVIVVSWVEDNPALRPDLLVWLPNLLFQTAGLALIIRTNRH